MTLKNTTQLDSHSWDLLGMTLSDPTARVVYISGPPGIGKTYSAQRDGLHDRDVVDLTVTAETPAAELRGFYQPRGGDFVWVDGPVVRAMKRGARLIINEVTHAGSDVLDFLHSVTESSETSSVQLPNESDERVTPAAGFQVVYTDNMEATQLPDALQSRLSAQVHIEHPHPKAIERIDERYRELACRSFAVSSDIEGERRTSLRQWLRLTELWNDCRYIDESNERDAFELCFGAAVGVPLFDAFKLAE